MHTQHFQVTRQPGRNYLSIFGFLLFCLGVTVSGCALSEQRVHPEFEVKVKTVAQPVLLPPDVTMLEILPGGLIRQREDWSAASRQNLQEAIKFHLEHKNYILKPLAVDSRTAPEIAQIQSLYRLVHKSMHQQTFHSHQSSQTGRRFEYSLGSIDGLLDNLAADSLIFVSGYDRVSDSGRKALIELAIADSSGSILYYSVKGTIQGNDLRDPASAKVMAGELLSGLSRIN
jgi:DNA-binding PadR family transcriptional regulator